MKKTYHLFLLLSLFLWLTFILNLCSYSCGCTTTIKVDLLPSFQKQLSLKREKAFTTTIKKLCCNLWQQQSLQNSFLHRTSFQVILLDVTMPSSHSHSFATKLNSIKSAFDTTTKYMTEIQNTYIEKVFFGGNVMSYFRVIIQMRSLITH